MKKIKKMTVIFISMAMISVLVAPIVAKPKYKKRTVKKTQVIKKAPQSNLAQYNSQKYIEEAFPYVNSADWNAVGDAYKALGQTDKAKISYEYAKRMNDWEAKKNQSNDDKKDKKDEKKGN